MNTGRNSKQTTCLCRDTGGMGARTTTFNTLDNWGHKTPTQSKRKRTGKKGLKGHGPEHVYNTLGYTYTSKIENGGPHQYAFCYINMVLTMYFPHSFSRLQGVGDEKTFLKEFKNRLISEYKQEWSDSIATNERYLMYNTFKSSLTMSQFLHDLKHIKARNSLLRIRLGVSQLRSHRLRFARNAKADLACPFCNHEIESEIHFILSCPM